MGTADSAGAYSGKNWAESEQESGVRPEVVEWRWIVVDLREHDHAFELRDDRPGGDRVGDARRDRVLGGGVGQCRPDQGDLVGEDFLEPGADERVVGAEFEGQV